MRDNARAREGDTVREIAARVTERKCSATKANRTEEPSRFFNLRTLKTEFWVKG